MEPLAEQHRLFSQSRILSLLNWQTFEQRYRTRPCHPQHNASNSTESQPSVASSKQPAEPSPSIECCHEYDEALIFNFNGVHFHQQIYDALSRNPLSTIYSLAWSLCLHVEARIEHPENYWPDLRQAPYPSEAEYTRVWFPFILLHRMTEKLIRLLSNLADKQVPSNSDAEQEIFTFNDIREAEQRLRDAYYSLTIEADQTASSSNDQTSKTAKQNRFKSDIEAYLQSALFQRQCQQTPYGTVELIALNNKSSNQYQARFIRCASNVSDKKKFIYNFKRHQAYEPLRAQIEQTLRNRFPHYHQKHGIYIESWLFSLISNNEANVTAESGQRSYAIYWQFQMSSLLWILIHSLFALDATLNHLMLEDLLWFIAHGVERFIHCGDCQRHWTAVNGGQAEWQQYEAAFMAQHPGTDDNSIAMAFSSTPYDSFDQKMFITHNNIQERNYANKGVTQATLHALRQDYAHFAAAFIGCLVADSQPQPHRQQSLNQISQCLPFRCAIYDLEFARRDLCRLPSQLYRHALLQDQQQIMQMANDDATVMACRLALERQQSRPPI